MNQGKVPPSPKARLMAKLGPPTASGCREWQGRVNKDGYGEIWFEGRRVRTHVLRFIIEHGYQPPMVCHTCDNPPCCEIDHLFAGSHKENVADMVAKGRVSAKLTANQVLEILATPCKYGASKLLAEKFGVHRNAIHAARSGRAWKRLHTPNQ